MPRPTRRAFLAKRNGGLRQWPQAMNKARAAPVPFTSGTAADGDDKDGLSIVHALKSPAVHLARIRNRAAERVMELDALGTWRG